MAAKTRIIRYYTAATEGGFEELKSYLKAQRKVHGWPGRVRTAQRILRAKGHRFTVYLGWVEGPLDAPDADLQPVPTSEDPSPPTA
jgi:hypothetical protein